MSQAIKSNFVSFRVDDEEWQLLEAAAAASGAKVRDWCRKLALESAGRERGLTKNERLIFEELSRVRYLIGHGFRLLLTDNNDTAEAWEDARATAEQKANEIADQLLAKSRTNNRP